MHFVETFKLKETTKNTRCYEPHPRYFSCSFSGEAESLAGGDHEIALSQEILGVKQGWRKTTSKNQLFSILGFLKPLENWKFNLFTKGFWTSEKHFDLFHFLGYISQIKMSGFLQRHPCYWFVFWKRKTVLQVDSFFKRPLCSLCPKSQRFSRHRPADLSSHGGAACWPRFKLGWRRTHRQWREKHQAVQENFEVWSVGFSSNQNLGMVVSSIHVVLRLKPPIRLWDSLTSVFL